ncbi:Hypothetical predicted protein [Cloeon dipterum]|uniref:PHD-type domain-containing protein n=2 Tax=Cloeon dipterum TaxID=197152 RepID=A0A8S1CUQ2_9INSE|nr:Hypothetical predicted protein [Cloeon dipterum]
MGTKIGLHLISGMAYGGNNWNGYQHGYNPNFTGEQQFFNSQLYPDAQGRPPWHQEWDQISQYYYNGSVPPAANRTPARNSQFSQNRGPRNFTPQQNRQPRNNNNQQQQSPGGQHERRRFNQNPRPYPISEPIRPLMSESQDNQAPVETPESTAEGAKGGAVRKRNKIQQPRPQPSGGRPRPGKRWSREGEAGRQNSYGNGYSYTEPDNSSTKENEQQKPIPQKREFNPRKPNFRNKDMSQREFLIHQMNAEKLECMVCYESIKHKNPIWSCSGCFNLFHIWCVQKWSRSTDFEEGWRCPGCNMGYQKMPEKSCYCGKTLQQARDMNLKSYSSKHCCEEICHKKRPRAVTAKFDCEHPCSEMCHPGPCPPCEGMSLRHCPCGKKSTRVKCGVDTDLLCDNTCDKLLACGRHRCQDQCHTGSCSECLLPIDLECMCGQEKKEVVCKDAPKGDLSCHSCKKPCGKQLECGNHMCADECHAPPCSPCPLLPEINTRCLCGKVAQSLLLLSPRKSCLDPVPQCPNKCNRTLLCEHNCPEKCHTCDCPPCQLQSQRYCACGSSKKMIPCSLVAFDAVTCNKKCTKWLSCLRHKCHDICCRRETHDCLQLCNKFLNCGRHKCDALCHTDRCPPCLLASFDELRCECQTEVIYPPVPCGTRPPQCSKPCTRSHPCGHNSHNCHSEEECPPCTVQVRKWCMGKHKEVYPVLCNQEFVSCHLLCGKPLECGQHHCIKKCHAGPCLNERCTQSCTKQRAECGHSCNSPCHGASPCPDTKCMFELKVTCECKTISEIRPCHKQLEAYKKKVQMEALVENMSDLMQGHKVPLPGAVPLAHWTMVVGLECDHNCAVKKRNDKFFIGLQIVNPDLGQKLKLDYPSSLQNWVAQDKEFVKEVHNTLAELVLCTQKGTQRFRMHSFGVMNQAKRKFVHEYSTYFGLTSQSIDKRHSRSVDVTAEKNNCWIPSISLHEMVGKKLSHSNSKSSLREMSRAPATKQEEPAAPAQASSSSTVLSYTQALAAKKN